MSVKLICKRCTKKFITLQRLYRWYRKQSPDWRYPDWHSLLGSDVDEWNEYLKLSKKGVPILLATGIGSHMDASIFESLLAVALTLRGADVHMLYCDSFLPACLMCEIGLMRLEQLHKCGPTGYFCKNCFNPAKQTYDELGLQVHRYSELVTQEELQSADRISFQIDTSDIHNYSADGIKIGEHAVAGTLRYFATCTLNGQPAAGQILRRYFKASLLTASVIRRLVNILKFRCVVLLHGIYVPHGIIAEVCRKENVRVVTWNPSYRKSTFVFSHNDTYHHTLMSEPVEKWENISWNSQLESDIMDYLISRQTGGRDWITFSSSNPDEDLSVIGRKIGVDFSKPCIGMLTNVAWDAQLHYPANAFDNMLEWVLKTIQYFTRRPDLQLIIRIHPAEVSGDIPSRQPILGEIKKRFPVLPENIFVIRPESIVSTYKLMEQCNAVIIYGTKTGVELTSRGIPVIVAGEAWIRNKRLTMDAKSQEEYFQILDKLPLHNRMDDEQVENARKYAYHFFFRRMIPVSSIEPTRRVPKYRVRISSLRDLLPGRDRGLDVICQGILEGTDFVYPA